MKGFFVLSVFVFSQLVTSQSSKPLDSLLKVLDERNISKKEEITLIKDIALIHPDIDSALFYAQNALEISKNLNDYFLQAQVLEVISVKQHTLGNNTLSLKSTFDALKIYNSLGLKEEQAACYIQLANNYMSEKSYYEAIKYLKKARELYKISSNKNNIIFTLLNIGEMYRLAGYLDSAKISFKKVLELNKKRNNDIAQSYTLGNLGMVYNTQDSLDLAKQHLDDAITILKKLGDPYATSVYLAELGDVHQKERDPKTAESQFLEAMAMAQEAGLKEQIRDFSEKLTQFYENQGKYKKALTYQRQFQVYQDSLVNKANIQEIERLKAGYEIDKRESRIGLLHTVNTKQKYVLWALGGGVLTALIFLYLLYRGNRRIKKANSTLATQKETITQREQEKALLLRELNHRVKNNLQMIASLLSLQSHELTGHPAKEAILAGKDRVEALSLVHRKLYQEGAETRIALREYIEELVLGLFHGYKADFDPEFVIEDLDVSIDTAIPLALIINELVVNALKYAYDEITQPQLIIKVQQNKNTLVLEVMDNGKGFSKKTKETSNSFGLKLITSLVEQLEGTLERKKHQGTHWVIMLPLGIKTVEEKTSESK